MILKFLLTFIILLIPSYIGFMNTNNILINKVSNFWTILFAISFLGTLITSILYIWVVL